MRTPEQVNAVAESLRRKYPGHIVNIRQNEDGELVVCRSVLIGQRYGKNLSKKRFVRRLLQIA